MFWIELFSKKTVVAKTKSYFDDDVNDYAIWDWKYNSKSVISTISDAELIWLYRGWTYACVNVRSDWIASLKPTLHPSETRLDAIKEDSVMELIDWELLKAVTSMLDVFWSVYILKETIWAKVVWLKLLRSDSVKTHQDQEGNITSYTYYSGRREYPFDKDDLIVIHLFNPAEQYPNKTTGVSPTMAVAKQQLMDLMSVEWNYLFFKEWGKPWTILTTDKKIDEDLKTRIIQKWKTFFSWLNNSHKTAILDNWLKYQSTTVGQREMEFSKQREFTREEILAIFRVSLPLLWKSDWVGFADRQVPEYYFQKYALLPLARQIENAFNKQLFKGNWYFTFGKIVSADLQGLNTLFMNWALSVNELRTANWFGAIKGWEVNNAGVDMSLDVKKEKSLFTTSDKDTIFKAFKGLKKKSKEEEAEKLWKAMVKRADSYEKQFEKEVTSIFNQQEKIIISNIKTSKSIKSFLESWKKGLFDDLTAGLMWLTGWTVDIIKKIVKTEWDEAYKLTGAEGSFDETKLDKWVLTDVTKFWKDIDNTTKTIILDLVERWYDEWLSETAIIKNIEAEFWKFKKNRVKSIVRTESTKAISKSNEEAYRQGGIEKKEWYTSIDERRCEHCKAMHWKIIKIGEKFYNKWETTSSGLKLDYEAIVFPPLHTMCRCILLPVT